VAKSSGASLTDTLKRLDALDRRRREAATRSPIPMQGTFRVVN
jgi:hypothetical protein